MATKPKGKKPAPPKKVIDRYERWCLYDLEGKISDLIEALSVALETYGKDSSLVLRHEYYGADAPELYICYREEETDKEYERRKKKEEATRKAIATKKAAKEARERKQYEKLKAKFG